MVVFEQRADQRGGGGVGGHAGWGAERGDLEVRLTAVMPGGWAYLRVPEPGAGEYRLARVVRSDGREIAVNTNVWVTRYTFVKAGQRPVKESRLHLLDHDSPGSYTLTYVVPPVPDAVPPVSGVSGLAAQSPAHFAVLWSGQDAGSGVSHYDLFVSVNGGPYLPWLQKTKLNGSLYQGQLGSRYAFYSVATDEAGNQEGAPSAPDAQTSVTVQNSGPVMGAVANRVIDEGETLRMSVGASDADGAANVLTYSLGPGAPSGMTIDAGSGELIWATGRVRVGRRTG